MTKRTFSLSFEYQKIRLNLEVLKYIYITLFIYVYILNTFLSMVIVTSVESSFANLVIGKGIITAAEGFKGTDENL